MNELVITEDAKAADSASITLAQWMGRREAFSLVAGRCSAADVEIIRRIRDDKLYVALDCTWEEFCVKHLRVSRRSVEREIGNLREYGPSFFTVRQLTHISVADYKKIAPHVQEQHVHMNGSLIPIDPHNSTELSNAIDELLQESSAKEGGAEPSPLEAILKRCRSVAHSLRSYAGTLDDTQTSDLVSVVAEIRQAAAGLGARIWDR